MSLEIIYAVTLIEHHGLNSAVIRFNQVYSILQCSVCFEGTGFCTVLNISFCDLVT